MKALPTQFDDKRLSNAVATPTCSSCCCCCCCLATTITSSKLLAQRISKEGEKRRLPNRQLLTWLAALLFPAVGVLSYILWMLTAPLLSGCGGLSYMNSGYGSNCRETETFLILPIVLIMLITIIFYLYRQVHIQRPFTRAAIVTSIIVAAFAIEFFAGAAILLESGLGVLYFIFVPVIIWSLSRWHKQRLARERK